MSYRVCICLLPDLVFVFVFLLFSEFVFVIDFYAISPPSLPPQPLQVSPVRRQDSPQAPDHDGAGHDLDGAGHDHDDHDDDHDEVDDNHDDNDTKQDDMDSSLLFQGTQFAFFNTDYC